MKSMPPNRACTGLALGLAGVRVSLAPLGVVHQAIGLQAVTITARRPPGATREGGGPGRQRSPVSRSELIRLRRVTRYSCATRPTTTTCSPRG